MKIFLLIGSLDVGGAETQLVRLAEGFSRAGNEVVFAALKTNGPLRYRLEKHGIEYHQLQPNKMLKFTGRIAIFIAFFRLFYLLKSVGPEVILSYLPLTSFIGSLAARLARVPCIVSGRRALATHQDKHKWAKFIDRLTNLLSHIIIANSQAVKIDHERRDGLPEGTIQVIHNALNEELLNFKPSSRNNLRVEIGLSPKQTIILSVGNLIPYKGHRDLIEAVSQLNDPEHQFVVVIAGRKENQADELMAHANRLGVKLKLLGPRADIPALLDLANLFVLPSHEEGSSNALLEAILLNVPSVATDVGGNVELLANGTGGWIAEPRNPKSLAVQISAALRDRLEQETRTKRAKAHVLGLIGDMDTIVSMHLKLFDQVLVKSGA